jgi:Ca-activated chloride channel family protein
MRGRSGVPSWVPYVGAVLAGLAVITGAQTWVRAHEDTSCRTTLRVTSSTEKAKLVRALAESYNDARRALPSGGCAVVAVDAIAAGWSADRAEGHPRPDVWLPTSSMWLDELRANPAYPGRGRLPTDWRSLARSPIVIAMPDPMARALGWPAKALTWADVLGLQADHWIRNGHPEWGRFTFAKDDPVRSTSGFAATVVTYFAGTGKRQGLTTSDVTSGRAQQFVQQVEANVVYHPSDIMNFLRTLSEADQLPQAQPYFSAVVMQEELVYLHNKGVPDGDPAKFGGATGARQPLVAILPSDSTMMMDHPYVELPGLSTPEHEAAEDFRDFLVAPQQQAGFAGLGFRNDRGEAPADLRSTLQLASDGPPSQFDRPSVEVITAIRANWREVSKRANLLILVDRSGSMRNPSGIPGQADRMAAAKSALRGATGALNPEDTVGLWGFASDPTNPHSPLLPMSALGDGAAFRNAVDGLDIALPPHDNTALCDSIRDAHEHLRTHLDPKRINAVVVLSDGRHDFPENGNACATTDLGAHLTATDPQHLVKVFGIGFGNPDETDFPALQQVCTATGANAIDLTTDPEGLSRSLISVLNSVSPGR